MARLREIKIGTLGQLPRFASVPYDASRPWLVVHDSASLDLAAEVCEGAALQLLGQHAPGQAQLLLFQSSIGPQFEQTKRLLAAADKRWGAQIHQVGECLKQLAALEVLASQRFTLLAQTGAADIYAYNATAARPEAIIYLLLSGLDTALAEQQPLQQLQKLCAQGAAVGIVPLLLRNTSEEADPHLGDFRRQALQNFWQAAYRQATGLDVRGQAAPINISAQGWQLLQHFGLRLGVGQDQCKAWADGLLQRIRQVDATNTEQDFLHIRIGLAGANPVHFSLGERSNVYNVMVGGMVRTGKTTLLNNILIKACETHTPQELQFTLIDLKAGGVHFWEYAGLAHVAQTYSPPEDRFAEALVCLERFRAELQYRSGLFREQRVARLVDYNQKANVPIPRHLLVIDEVQRLFDGCDFTQKQLLSKLFKEVATTGAAYGLHIILSTQSYQNVDLNSGVMGQFHLRIGFRLANSMDCRSLMGRDNDEMLNLERFHAIYNARTGEERHNILVAMDNLPDEEFHRRLDALKAKYPRPPQPETKQEMPDMPLSTPPEPEVPRIFGGIKLW